jgi:hypothetical protein
VERAVIGRVSRWALLMTVLALATACGARVAPSQDALVQATGPAADVAAAADNDIPGADPTAEADVPGVAGAEGPSPGGAASPAPGREWANAAGAPQDRPVVRLRLSAACVEPGQILNVLVLGPPRASIAMSATFEGSDKPGGRIIGLTDDRGEFRWAVPVPPHVRPGAGWIGVAATGPNRGPGGGVAREQFQVAAIRGCG